MYAWASLARLTMGVPVRHHRIWARRAMTTLKDLVSRLRMLWAWATKGGGGREDVGVSVCARACMCVVGILIVGNKNGTLSQQRIP